jgi:hypothetical protein
MKPLALSVLVCLAACGGAAAPALTPSLVAPHLLAGEATAVVLRAEADCPGLGDLQVTTMEGDEPPAWLEIAIDRFMSGLPPIGNPSGGSISPGSEGVGIATCFGCYVPSDRPGDRLFYEAPFDGYQLVLTPAAGAPAGPVPLLVLATGCGSTWRGGLTPVVTSGAADLAGFCGWTLGEGCQDDADCSRGGSFGQVCALVASSSSPAAPVLACSDPVRFGAHCGCQSGTCAWRVPQ